MKTLFITALTCSGVAWAAAGSPTLSEATLGYEDFSSGVITQGLTSTTVSKANGVITYTAPEGSNFGTKTGNYIDFTVTMVFNAEQLTKLVNAGTNGWVFKTDGYQWGFGIQDDGTSKASWNGSYWGNAVATANLLDNVAADGTITLTYSASSTGTAVGINDSVAIASSSMSGLKWDAATIHSFTINDAFSNAIEQVYVFSTWAQNEAAVDGLYAETAAITAAKAIPEPATATLSLLALAGLAARRRRK